MTMKRSLLVKLGLCGLMFVGFQPYASGTEPLFGGPFEIDTGLPYGRNKGGQLLDQALGWVTAPYWAPDGAPDPFDLQDCDIADNVRRVLRVYESEWGRHYWGPLEDWHKVSWRAWPGETQAQERGWLDPANGDFIVLTETWGRWSSIEQDWPYYHLDTTHRSFAIPIDGLAVGDWPEPEQYVWSQARTKYRDKDPVVTGGVVDNPIAVDQTFDAATANFTFVGFKMKVDWPSGHREEEEWGVSETYLYDQESSIPQYKWAFIDNAAMRWRWGHQASDPGEDLVITVGRINNRDGGLESICPAWSLKSFAGWEEVDGQQNPLYLWYSTSPCTVFLQHE